MRKKTPRVARDSAIASGWTVEGEPTLDPDSLNDAAPASAPSTTESGLTDGRDTDRDDSVEAETAETAEAAPRFSNAALVLLGVCGGLYLLYSWIWLSWAQYASTGYAESAAASGALGGALLTVVFWLAPVAPLLWFFTTLIMNYQRSMKHLVFWILLGAVILVPLPVFGGGGA